jgi:hypothetical protein
MNAISMTSSIRAAALALAGFAAAPASAVELHFTEHFATDAANWFDTAGAAPVTWNAAGGPDGSSFVSTNFNFVSSAPDGVPVLFRAQDEFGSSGGAFFGNWLAAPVSEMTFFVRHNASAPVNFFARFSGPANFPGATAIVFAPVLPNQWTPISILIHPINPSFIFEGPSTFGSVFSNIGHLQIGVDVPDSLAGVDQDFTFDLDQVSIVPAPGALALLAMAGWSRRRRRRVTSVGGVRPRPQWRLSAQTTPEREPTGCRCPSRIRS